MNNHMKKLLTKIAKDQISYHITGDDFQNEHTVSYTTPSGTDVTYIAKRDYAQRGYGFSIWKNTISIKKGYKEDYLGSTNPWGRETVDFRPSSL